LELFTSQPSVVRGRDRIFDEVWATLPAEQSHLDQHISKLRKRIERDPRNPAIIQTVPWRGLPLPTPPERTPPLG